MARSRSMGALGVTAVGLLANAAGAGAIGCAPLHGQCGGDLWEGPTCCAAGSVCTLLNASGEYGPPGGYGDEVLLGAYGEPPGPPVPALGYKQCLPPVAGPGLVEPQELTIVEALAGMEAGDFTSEELVLVFLTQIAKYEDTYNAFTFLNENALGQARASDLRRASGKLVRPMEGVPVVIKEALDYFGKPSTWGWNYTSAATGGVNLYPLQNAALVQRLLDAGAIIIGKTNIPAFSLDSWRTFTSWAGVTLNAVNPTLAPGASSAGTATAVAAGFCVWGVAEETGGSIQNPGASQSLVAVQTTFGIVPTLGVTPLAGATRDVLGPLTKTVEDAALALDVMTGYGTPEFVGVAPPGGYTGYFGKMTLKGKRIGLYGPGWENLPLEPETAKLYDQAIKQLEALEAEVVEDPFAGTGFADLKFPEIGYDKRGSESIPNDFYEYLKNSFNITGFDALAEILGGVQPFQPDQPLGQRQIGLPEPEFSILLDGVQDPSAKPNLKPFEDLKAAYLTLLEDTMTGLRLDALIYPQLTAPYPLLYDDEEPVETTVSEVNIMGTPVVTVPSAPGTRADGTIEPFALSFTGLPNTEAELLALAYDYERAYPSRVVAELSTTV